jgi:gas vesicle protein
LPLGFDQPSSFETNAPKQTHPEATMANVDIQARHELHTRLDEVLGKKHAETMMSSVLPDWNKLATKDDLALLQADVALVKFDVAGLRSDLVTFRSDLQSEIATVRTDLMSEIAAVRTDLTSEIAAVRTDLTSEIAAVRTDLTSEIAAVRTDLTSEIATTRTDLQSEIATTRTDLQSEIATVKADIAVMGSDLRSEFYQALNVQTWRLLGGLAVISTVVTSLVTVVGNAFG